jgi:cytochrome c oxidase subunit 2
MDIWSRFLPEQASTMASRVDAFWYFLVGLSVFFIVLIGGLELYFALKYRRKSPDEIPLPVRSAVRLEMVWIVIPFLLSMVIFAWGASIFFSMTRSPEDPLDIYVTGKQWMWRIQHMEGRREINELHIPVGRKVRLTMTSEDVIHGFFVPAFRVKFDVLPGRYTSMWFEATKPGRYHLFCTEYCGTDHSRMVGWVHAMEPADFQAWLSGAPSEGTLASSGERLFEQLACHTCHREDAKGRGPVLDDLFGGPVALADGTTVVADEAYIRESILNPQAKIVAGYEAPVRMPTFQGQVDEEQLLQLIEYIKSLGTIEPAAAGIPVAATGTP